MKTVHNKHKKYKLHQILLFCDYIFHGYHTGTMKYNELVKKIIKSLIIISYKPNMMIQFHQF